MRPYAKLEVFQKFYRLLYRKTPPVKQGFRIGLAFREEKFVILQNGAPKFAKKKKCGRLSVLYLKTICMKIDVLTILYGTIITFTTTIALLAIMLKYRSKVLLELILTYKNSFNLVLHPVLIYVFVFEVSMIISDNLPSGIFSLSGTLI